ncbi:MULTISPECIES: DUF7139 domain-containing protein [Halomicrobium]|uniref:Cell division protein A N-terminal domain-containing protein n=2 Tax=Halomicrobium mukohataei TaxID=57705 RepID=C7P1D3_HALMD|nr:MULTISPECIES: hypothetical protein [Halomicrobium]ACV47141.1 conserved hypothetical protein [Halomicrobium mukohataei DSM 12286]QCD65623.1 hypothetical protein E5139_08225 [Halomicrobium mukohataei]QFR20429.1 hypothetical protein GBQ70_08220 [Halomicrobium sp. ZPS1]
MESLGDAYGGSRWNGRDPRRVYAGVVLFAVGVLAVVVGILIVTTPLGTLLGADSATESQSLAGVLAGLGVPASLASVVVVLPATRRERVGVLAGTLLCVVGVGLFAYAYPARWTGTAQSLAFPTTTVYFLGGSLAFWFVFTAVAGYRIRNNPHGTVRLELRREGETRTVELSRQEYSEYKQVVRGDGGETEQVIRELEERVDE